MPAPDDPTVVALPAGEFRHYLPALGPRDAVIGISASGEFRDVLAVVDALRGRVPTVGIVHVPGSTLDRTADSRRPLGRRPKRRPGHDEDVRLHARGGRSSCSASCSAANGPRRIRAGIAAAADHVDAAIAAAAPRVPALADALVGARHCSSSAAATPPGCARGRPEAQGDGDRPRRGGRVVGDGVGRGHDRRAEIGRRRARSRRPGTRRDGGDGPSRRRLGCPHRRGRRRARAPIEGADLLPLPAAADEDLAPAHRRRTRRPARLRARSPSRPRPRPPGLGRALPQPGAAAHRRRRRAATEGRDAADRPRRRRQRRVHPEPAWRLLLVPGVPRRGDRRSTTSTPTVSPRPCAWRRWTANALGAEPSVRA